MSRDFGRFVAWLKSLEPRMSLSDPDLVEMFWRAHPRFNFFKSLPWGANLLDIGAGNGGLVYWKDWLTPQRADLNLYGVDRNVGEHRDLYAGWEAVDLDAAPPSFPAVKLNAFFASHVIEYLAAPESLLRWLATRAEPGARLYLEWTSPATLDLPAREQLHKFDIDVVTSNFMDDWEHKQSPDLPNLCSWLTACGFEVMSSGAVDAGIVGEELFAHGGDPHMRSMGYWSLTHSSLYAVAVRTDQPVAATPGPVRRPATARRSQALRQIPDAASDVTVVLTSCGRQDLLEQTLDSFFAYNTYPIRELIVIEDGDGHKNEHLSQKYQKYSLTWLDTGARVGQVTAMDVAYSYVKTDFIFHCEDDWEFLRPRFIERSLMVLNADEKVLQVYLRDKDDTNGHPVSDRVYFAEWVPYRLVARGYDAGKWGVWHGFSWNPGLRRRRDYQLLGSFGSLDPSGTKLPWQIERDASAFYRKHDFVAAILAEDCGPGYVRHLGDDRHVPEIRNDGSGFTSHRINDRT